MYVMRYHSHHTLIHKYLLFYVGRRFNLVKCQSNLALHFRFVKLVLLCILRLHERQWPWYRGVRVGYERWCGDRSWWSYFFVFFRDLHNAEMHQHLSTQLTTSTFITAHCIQARERVGGWLAVASWKSLISQRF